MILRHPIAFWSMPQVRLSAAPAEGFVPAMAIRTVATAVSPLLLLWTLLFLLEKSPLSMEEAARGVMYAFVVAGSYGLLGLLILLVVAGIHILLCRLAIPPAPWDEPQIDAVKLVGYGLIWGGWNLPLVSVMQTGPTGLSGMVWLVVFAGVNFVWAVTLYSGTLAATNGRHGRAVWCTMCNPAWWPAHLLLGMNLLQ
jgi:hypothetical protein